MAWIAACLSLLLIPAAAQPVTNLPNYKQTVWNTDSGAPPEIQDIAQTPDGFLWLAAQTGLYRFDGVSFTLMPPVQARFKHSRGIRKLLVSRSGDLWVGYEYGGLAVYHAGKLRDANVGRPSGVITAIVETKDGAIWVGAFGLDKGNLRRFMNGTWTSVRDGWGLPREEIRALLAARDGSLYVYTAMSVLRLAPGAHSFERIATPVLPTDFAEDAAGRIWIVTGGRVGLLSEGLPTGPNYATDSHGGVPEKVLFDPDGNLWIADVDGLFVQNHGSVMNGQGSPDLAAPARVVGLDRTLAVFADQEGTLWVSSLQGLVSLRPTPAVQQAVEQITNVDYLLNDSTGTTYLVADRHAYALDGPAPTIRSSLPTNWQVVCAAFGRGLWVADANLLYHVGAGPAPPIPLPPNSPLVSCAEDGQARLWITTETGTYVRRGGQWDHLTIVPGKPGIWAHSTMRDRHGDIVFVFGFNGIWRTDGVRTERLLDTDYKPFGYPLFAYEGATGLIVGGEDGLVRVRDGKTQFLSAMDYPFLNRVAGYVETRGREVWLASATGLFHLPISELDRAFDHPGTPLSPAPIPIDLRFPGLSLSRNTLAEDAQHRVWITFTQGVRRIDLSMMRTNRLAPSVIVTRLVAGEKVFDDPNDVALGTGVTRVELDYTATSLAEPSRVAFRYRLDGVDGDWIDPGRRRQAFYTNLPPGTYRFHVIAANNDGVWNRKGATLTFAIAPTFLQSRSFLALCILAAILLLWAAYTARTRQLSANIRVRLEGQLAERERIARELHDTLLQSFQGLVLRFQAVLNRMSHDDALRIPLGNALDSAESVLAEGRDRVSELRFATKSADLEDALAEVAQDQFGPHATPVIITVEGEPRPLVPMVREELFRIGEEAIGNAIRHARAHEIEVVLVYSRELRLSIRDDGVGIPPDIMADGRRIGHFGLIGMRERVERIGGRMLLTSSPEAGTEVRISVPGRLAFSFNRPRRGKSILRPPWRSAIDDGL